MRRGDFVVIALIICVALGVLAYSRSFLMADTEGEKAVSVRVEGKEVKRIPLVPGTKHGHVTVDTPWGHNLIGYDGEGAWMEESTCPDKICLHMAKITRPGEMIVCLPHRLSLEVEAENSSDEGLDVMLR